MKKQTGTGSPKGLPVFLLSPADFFKKEQILKEPKLKKGIDFPAKALYNRDDRIFPEKRKEETMSIRFEKLTETARAELDARYRAMKAETEQFAPQPTPTGAVYYFSALRGNDEADGTTPDTPWKSLTRINDLAQGCTVLIECGSVFHQAPRPDDTSLIYPKSGMTFAAYGKGAKPVLYGSIDARGAENWVQVAPCVYRFATPVSRRDDIANISFDGGKAWGIKIQMTYSKDSENLYTVPAYCSLALENVCNGLTTYEKLGSFPLRTGAELQSYDLCYYHNLETGDFYLYSEGGNPGDRFSSIELARKQKIFLAGKGVENLTFLNLDLRCAGEFGIRTCNTKNLVVKNCSFFFIGGAVQPGFGKSWRNYDTRLGNAIENWGFCEGMTVENCYFDQIYDAAITTQANDNVQQTKQFYRGNVIRRAYYGVELWTGDNAEVDRPFIDFDISGNYFNDCGLGLATTRPDKHEWKDGTPIDAFIKSSRGLYRAENVKVVDNIVDGAAEKMYYCSQPATTENQNGYLFDRNTYIFRRGAVFAGLPADLPTLTGKYTNGKYAIETKAYAYTEEDLKTLAAAGIDANSTFYYL